MARKFIAQSWRLAWQEKRLLLFLILCLLVMETISRAIVALGMMVDALELEQVKTKDHLEVLRRINRADDYLWIVNKRTVLELLAIIPFSFTLSFFQFAGFEATIRVLKREEYWFEECIKVARSKLGAILRYGIVLSLLSAALVLVGGIPANFPFSRGIPYTSFLVVIAGWILMLTPLLPVLVSEEAAFKVALRRCWSLGRRELRTLLVGGFGVIFSCFAFFIPFLVIFGLVLTLSMTRSWQLDLVIGLAVLLAVGLLIAYALFVWVIPMVFQSLLYLHALEIESREEA